MSCVRLLYIEEDRTHAGLIKKQLEEEGFETEIVHIAAKAITTFKETHPDLVMVGLEGRQGEEALDVIRYIYLHYPHFPVIVYSASTDPEFIIQTMGYGVMHHIGKHTGIPELVAWLRNALYWAYPGRSGLNREYRLSQQTVYNISTYVLTIGEKVYPLKRIEALLLRRLCMNINEFVSSLELSMAMWNMRKNCTELRRYVTQLRKILEKNDPQIRILNRKGGFYQLQCNLMMGV